MVAFFWAPYQTPGQWNILRLVNALCAGCAGGFLIGEATLHITGEIATGVQATIDGTAGIAIFLIVWFTYQKYIPSPTLPEAQNLSVPEGWTFKQAADAIARQNASVIQYFGFTEAELKTVLRGQELQSDTAIGLLKALRGLAATNAIREYEVSFHKPVYEMRVRA